MFLPEILKGSESEGAMDRKKTIQVFEDMKRGLYPMYPDEYLDTAIEALSAEPCEDAISRQSVDEMIKAEMPERGMWEIDGDKEKETVCEVCVDLMQKLSELPSVTPKQETVTEFADRCRECGSMLGKQKMGHWIECMPSGAEEWCYKCSECNFWKYKKIINLSKFKYCPNCGARMEKSGGTE